jgi:hypothetical protein
LFHKAYAEVVLKVGCICSTSGNRCQYRLGIPRIGSNREREEKKKKMKSGLKERKEGRMKETST